MNASSVKSLFALWLLFPSVSVMEAFHPSDSVIKSGHYGADSGRLTFVRPWALSVRACRCEVSGRRLISCNTHVGVTREERFKRTLMLNEIWQEDEELIPGCRRLIRPQERSFQIAPRLFIIDCITFSIRSRLALHDGQIVFSSSETLNLGCCAFAGL